MQCILVCFLKSLLLIKFRKIKYCFLHHYNGHALIFSLAYGIKYVLKRVSFGSKDCTKELKPECAYSWAKLASFCHLGVISDPLIVSKFHNETHDLKGQDNKIYTIVKGRETFYRRHTVPVTSCSEVKYVLKRVSFGSKDCTKELKPECAYSWARLASFCHLGVISDPLIVSKFHNETHKILTRLWMEL